MAFSAIVGYSIGSLGFRQTPLNNPVSPTPAVQEPTITQGKLKKEVSITQTQNDEAAMLEVAKSFCLAQGGTPCKTSLDKRKGNIANVKTESMSILLSKDSSNGWKVILANDTDSDVCKTGSDNPQIKELCSN